jgi:hypothetical protein
MKTVVLTALLAMSFVVFSGCSKKKEGKSEYHKGIEMICFAEQKAGAEGITDPSERAMKIANYLKANLKDEKAMKLMQSFATMAPDSRGTRLREEAKKAGLASCPMADEAGGQ